MTHATSTLPDLVGSTDTPRAQTWRISTSSGCTTTGYLPPWADDDPSATGVPTERLGIHLADIVHTTAFSGQLAALTSTAAPAEDVVILCGTIECRPYAEAPDPRLPVANLQLVDDYWMNDLDPDQLAEISAKLRVQADHLDRTVRPALIAARADWATHHPPC